MIKILYYGDNLDILRQHVPDESVDLVYLDPPFNSNANYNVLFKEQSGEESPAQIRAFTDTWEWTQEAERTYEQEIITNTGTPASDLSLPPVRLDRPRASCTPPTPYRVRGRHLPWSVMFFRPPLW